MSGGNPVFVESGRRGARRRWGPQRIVRLDELTADQRAIVQAVIDAVRSVKAQPAATAEQK
jgi:hypothetical protein